MHVVSILIMLFSSSFLALKNFVATNCNNMFYLKYQMLKVPISLMGFLYIRIWKEHKKLV